jgi:hypothetical protein
MTLEEYEALRRLIGSERESEGAKLVLDGRSPRTKKKRKVSAYQKKYGEMYKSLKKKHPRMKFGALSKKAHALTRKEMKK